MNQNFHLKGDPESLKLNSDGSIRGKYVGRSMKYRGSTCGVEASKSIYEMILAAATVRLPQIEEKPPVLHLKNLSESPQKSVQLQS